MDAETRLLVAKLRQRDLAANDKALRPAPDAWTASRAGHVRGKTTEAGARFLLGQAGLL